MAKKRPLPFANATQEELTACIGKLVTKVSSKPFSNGKKFARVTGLIVHPHTGRPAFTFSDAKYCEVLRCEPIDLGKVIDEAVVDPISSQIETTLNKHLSLNSEQKK